MVDKKSDVEQGKVVAVLSYLVFLVGLIWFFADDKMRKNSFAKFHLKQAIVLVVIAIAYSIFASILSFILLITIIGSVLIPLLGLVWILFLVWVILGIINSVNGKEKELFWIGGLAKYLTF